MIWLALSADDEGLAREIATQLASAPKGLDSNGLQAYEHVLRGLLGFRPGGKDLAAAEAEVRQGIAALETYGAIPDRAIAQEHLARWLIDQGRSSDAAPLIEAARATYAELGAPAWLARIDQLTRVG